jgi:hypothetical protein
MDGTMMMGAGPVPTHLPINWRRGPVLGGPLWDILVLDVCRVDLYQDAQ